MKSFLEEYGFAILAAIVVILLIAMCTPVGNLIKSQVLGMVDRFAGSADKKLAQAEADQFGAMIYQDATGVKLVISGASKTDTFHYVPHFLSGNVDPNEGKAPNDATVSVVVAKEAYGDPAVAIASPDDKTWVYIEVIDDGTGEIFRSNTINLR